MTLMPMESRAGELWSLIRRHDGRGDHPAWAERVDELADVREEFLTIRGGYEGRPRYLLVPGRRR